MAAIATKVMASGAAQEMVIVMPDAGTTYDGYFNVVGWPYEDYFFQERIILLYLKKGEPNFM